MKIFKTCFLILLLPLFCYSQEKPNIVLISIDTLRADYLSIYFDGSSQTPKVKTPNIDRFAREGIYIRECESPAPLTTPSHASILTGLYPKNHQIHDNHHYRLKNGVQTLPEILSKNGYKSIGVVSAAPLRKCYGLDRGFDYFDDVGLSGQGDEALIPSSRNGLSSSKIVLDYVDKTNKKDPLFIFLHLYEPHKPYTPPKEYLEMYPNDLYAGEVAFTDFIIGEFLKNLFKKRDGKWIVVITSDHGEGLGDNLELTHGLLLYKETRTVPLIIWDINKKLQKAGKGVKSLIDITPTLLSILGINGSFDGKPIFEDTSGRDLLSETYAPLTSFSVNPAFSLRFEDKIFIKHGTTREVFLKGDEKKNLLEKEGKFAKFCEEKIRNFFDNLSLNFSISSVDEDQIKALKSLGYIGGNFEPSKNKIKECNLRDFVIDFNTLDMGRGYIQKGLYAQSLKYYDEFLEKYPSAPILYLEKGSALVGLERFLEAEEYFKKALLYDPKNSTALLNLGNISILKGNYKDAENFFLKCIEYEENSEAHLNLGILYNDIFKNKELAIKHFKKFLELQPNDRDAFKIKSLIGTLEGTTKK